MTDGVQDQSALVFVEARDAYRNARNMQRLLIVEALKSAGFEVKTRGNAGRGLLKYTSGGRLTPPFDLSNWMWVTGERDDVFVMVSLQVLDQDPKSMNVHALMDRVGVEVYRADDPVDENDPLFERATTELQLPLDSDSLATLVSLIEQKVTALS